MRLSGFKLPLERLSATSLSTFITCAEQWRRRYLLHEKETMYGERFIGSVQHQALKYLFDREFFERGGGEDVEKNAVNLAWQEIIEREGEPDWMEMDAAEMHRRSVQMIHAYWPIASKTEPIATEQRFEETIAGVPVVGYIDLELKDRIREVKTTSQKVSAPKPRWQLQARIYALASAKPVDFHVVTRQKETKIYTSEECPELMVPAFNPDTTVKIITHAVERMSDLYARYGKDNPWPMDGLFGEAWKCSRCFARKTCAAWS